MSGPHMQPTPADPESQGVQAEAARSDREPPTAASGRRVGATTLVSLRRVLFRLLAVVVVVVVAVLGYTLLFARGDATAAKVGDCVSITGPASAAHVRRVACSDSSALYVVTATGRTAACDVSEVTYSGSPRDRTRLCLFYNLRTGECLAVSRSGGGDTKGACAPGMLKVVFVDSSSADQTTCPPQADVARTDDVRNRLVCFVTLT